MSERSCLAFAPQAMGVDQALMKLFLHWRKVCVEIMASKKTINVVVRWGDEQAARTLIARQTMETRLEAPEDEIWELDLWGDQSSSSSSCVSSCPLLLALACFMSDALFLSQMNARMMNCLLP